MMTVIVASLITAVLLGACTQDITQTIRMSLSNRYNDTGHVFTEVRIEHLHLQASQRKSPWTLHLERSVAVRSETWIRYITATLIDAPERATVYELYPLVGRYKFHSTPQTWIQAIATCQEENAHLAVINSKTEEGVLKNLFSRNVKIENSQDGNKLFLGLNDIVEEGNFVTVLGESLSSVGYQKWSPGEPNNVGGNHSDPGQDCVAMTRGGTWDDIACTVRLAFICEQEL